MSTFRINIVLLTALLLAPTLSSIGNFYFFSTQGIILVLQCGSIQSSLQSVHAQEQDEETDGTEDEEDEDENQPDDDNNNEEDNEEEEDGQTDSVGVCCTWDERLADGILTYRITERVGEDDDDEEDDEDGEEDYNQDEAEFSIDDLSISDSDQRKAVTDAVNDWNTRIPSLKLVNEDSNVDADIEVQLVDGLGGMANC